ASGAWVNVQRHFRELGINVQEETFSVVGIGDMGGDVFGNGMLQSDKILLTAAFNHLHIFVDPNPADSVASFNERQRLFNLPRSSWADYNS
ncbi:NAD-glutamate dehydrogenase, partial [Klebsiella pneumoniae]